MKNGLLVYSDKYEYFNIGDYIQSLAAKQYFKEIDVYVCREQLDTYFGDDVKMIFNGWFTHEPDNWPPSLHIHPLFVSFHINSVAAEKLTNVTSISYLKKYEPIGCRDKKTAELLKALNVNAYFSGCLTLTLGKIYKRKDPDGKIYFVDPHFKANKDIKYITKYLITLLTKYRIIKIISNKMYNTTNMHSMLKASAFYGTYSNIFSDDVLTNAEYLCQEMRSSEISNHENRFLFAENLLDKYCSANFIVTSRIHCALPCLGIGTPVLYVENQQQAETSHCRLDGLRELLHTIKCNGSELTFNLTSKKITQNYKFSNKTDYQVLADNLEKACTVFCK